MNSACSLSFSYAISMYCCFYYPDSSEKLSAQHSIHRTRDMLLILQKVQGKRGIDPGMAPSRQELSGPESGGVDFSWSFA